jgi:hypothetical protein
MTWINCFNIRLRDGDGSDTSRVVSPQMLVYHALRRTKCSLGYVNGDVLVRIGTTILIKLMGSTGQAERRISKDRVMNATTFLSVISKLLYWLTASHDSNEFRAADPEVQSLI